MDIIRISKVNAIIICIHIFKKLNPNLRWIFKCGQQRIPEGRAVEWFYFGCIYSIIHPETLKIPTLMHCIAVNEARFELPRGVGH